jgi:hypothetical protein
MPKTVLLTAHARMRLRERHLKLEWIEDTVRMPDWRELDPRDPQVERRFRAIAQFDDRILRVACVETETSIRDIGVMLDRTARRKP